MTTLLSLIFRSIHLFCLFSSTLSPLSSSGCGMIDSSLGYPETGKDFKNIGISLLLLCSFSLSLSLTLFFFFSGVHYTLAGMALRRSLLIHSLLGGAVQDQRGWFVGHNDNPEPKEGDEVWMEADLRSGEKKKRTLHFFVNGKLEKIFFYNIPERVKIGVMIYSEKDCIEFVSLEELSSPSIPPNDYAWGYPFEGVPRIHDSDLSRYEQVEESLLQTVSFPSAVPTDTRLARVSSIISLSPYVIVSSR